MSQWYKKAYKFYKSIGYEFVKNQKTFAKEL